MDFFDFLALPSKERRERLGEFVGGLVQDRDELVNYEAPQRTSLLGDRTQTPSSVQFVQDYGDFLPIVGEATGAIEVGEELSKENPNYPLASALAAATAVGAVPVVGDTVARGITSVARKTLDAVPSDVKYATRAVVEGDMGGIIDAFRSGGVPKSVGAASTKRDVSFEEAPMIVQHNMTPKGLEISKTIGGIPMPSIGIANANAPLENFGEISLLLNPSKIAPRSDLPVYPADAYTGRQPKAIIDFENPRAAEKAVASDPSFSHMKDADYWMMSYDNFDDNDRMMRIAQYGMRHKVANPKDFDRFDDYVTDVERKMGGFIDSDELANEVGLSKYGDVQFKIAPTDWYTASGMRREPKPYTVDEAFKRMKKDKAFAAGSEMHHGAGQLRAVLLDKFKNLDDIKSKRGLLMASGNEMEDIKGSFDTIAFDEVADLANAHFDGRHRLAEDYITDLAMGNSVAYADKGNEARADATAALSRLKERVKDMPTEYFEAKPKSVAQVGDFDAAVVPEGDEGVIDTLKRAGVKDIRTYNDDVEGRRRADVIRQFRDLMFAAPLGGLLGYNVLAQQQDQQQKGLLY
jgi:hypothetical protein